MQRYEKMKMVQEEVRKGPWTEQEDLQLVCFVRLFGDRRWDFIAKVTGLNRSGKSCRLRWVNYLHPGLKRGKMTSHEERLVLQLHAKWGNRWSRIARKLPGRTDNEIKNYWRTHMRKKIQEEKRAMSPSSSPSNCSSLSSSGPKVDSVPLGETGEESFYDTGGAEISATTEHNNNKEEEKYQEWYSMDDIWKDIDLSEDNTIQPVYEYPPPFASPTWEYCPDSLWRMDEEESKMFPPVTDQVFSWYENERAYLTG